VTSPTQFAMTLEDFVQAYEDQPFELINGERFDRMPPLPAHSHISMILTQLLALYLSQNAVGTLYSETPFVLTESNQWVKGSRVPDLMFFVTDRIAPYKAQNPDWGEKPFTIVPDLAVEIISKHDRYTEVDAKVQSYLQDGVRLIWVIDPKQQVVVVHAPDAPTQRYGAADTLSSEAILPGFSLPVAQLFADLNP
jgi:Uma2 family endonuclease